MRSDSHSRGEKVAEIFSAMTVVMTRPSLCERAVGEGRLWGIGPAGPVPGVEPDRWRRWGENFFSGKGLTQHTRARGTTRFEGLADMPARMPVERFFWTDHARWRSSRTPIPTVRMGRSHILSQSVTWWEQLKIFHAN
jgi:hypothetical protein